ncbi:restriction endonuclease subunit S [Ruminococcus sp. JE7B6]|uniref:restriction endonuclease subunit S n=1 Tax=Ruminococcus sp. JE7B6 TaxID=3233380 RepID=UPI00389AB088
MAREMKDSGIEWIGEIPREWSVYPAKFAFSEIRNKNTDGEITKALKFYNGTIIPKSNFDANSDDYVAETITTYTVVKTDMIMINGLNLNYDLKSLRVGLVKEEGVITSAYLALMPDVNRILPLYATYLFKGYETRMAFHNMGAGIRKTLGFKEFKNQPVLIPSLSEQQAIADFLDTQCVHIDSVIEKTRAAIEEYKKLKQSVITQAVTKGIRPNREMKDSGIEWVHEIPVDWQNINPKAMFSLRKEKASVGEKQLTSSQNYGIIYQDEYMELSGSKVVTVQKDFDILKHVEKGDFVISMRSFQGGLEYSEFTGSISSAYVMLIPNKSIVYPKFFRWLFKSALYINALQSTSNMVRDGQAMRFSNFIQVRLYSVPLEEQKEIADYLDNKIPMIDSLITKKEKLINELETYKKSLIYEYVTGKKEVPVHAN